MAFQEFVPHIALTTGFLLSILGLTSASQHNIRAGLTRIALSAPSLIVGAVMV